MPVIQTNLQVHMNAESRTQAIALIEKNTGRSFPSLPLLLPLSPNVYRNIHPPPTQNPSSRLRHHLGRRSRPFHPTYHNPPPFIPKPQLKTSTEHSGAYLSDCTIAQPMEYAQSAAAAARLWALGEMLVGETF